MSKPPPGRTEPFVRLAALAVRERGATGKVNRPTTGDGVHAASDRATYEERAGALIKKASTPAGLDDERLERLWGRLEGRETLRGRRRAMAPVRWAVVATVLLVSGGLVAAKTGAWTWPRVVTQRLAGPAASVLPAPSPPHPRPPGRRVAAKAPGGAAPNGESVVPPSPPAVLATTPSPALSVSPSHSRSPSRSRSDDAHSDSRPPAVRHRARAALPVALPRPPVAAPESTLAWESALLGRALTRLRVERDAAGALVELDRYTERFPTGTLGHEAQRARVDALLILGRLTDARTVLAGLHLGAGARDRELRLIRAELTAESACPAALPDYEAVLADSSSGPLVERALWGRAACRTRVGDERGARADLSAYLDRFPAGAHAATARARIEK